MEWESPEWRNLILSHRVCKLFSEKHNRSPTPNDEVEIFELADQLKSHYSLI